MEEAKALAQHQQQLMLQQHHQQQQQQQQQQMFLLQQQLQQQQRQQHQQAAMARFPSNIDAHLFGTNNRPPNPNPNSIQQQSSPRPNPNPNSSPQQKLIRPPTPQPAPLGGNQVEVQMAYQDAWRVCHPDFKRPFSSLEDACERLLPYHVVADYEAEEDDRILDSDTTGQVPSRSQQWDHNIAAKVAEFTATFEKQALAFNIISRKRAMGEFRSEERLMIEQALLQEEKRVFLELRSELEREKATRDAHEANLRMAAALQAEQARAESQAHAELIARTPIRANALGSQASDHSMSHDMSEQEQGGNPDDMNNGWSNNASQREEREPSDDFLNDDEGDHGDTGMQEEWRGSGEFDLNTR